MLSSTTLRRIVKEVQDLTKNPVEGITIKPNEADITEINATIVGPSETPFEGGEFEIKLKLTPEFPEAPPKGFFLTKIFHPNVAMQTGEICVNTLKRDWKSSYGLQHILLTIKCLLLVPNPESSLNEEAGKLLLEQYDNYFATAKTWTNIHAKPRPRSVEDDEKQALNEINANSDKSKPVKRAVSKTKPRKAPAKKRGINRL